MPEIGATKLGGAIGQLIADARRQMEETRLEVAGAVTELMAEVAGYSDLAKDIRAERDQVRKDVNELRGNGPPAGVTVTVNDGKGAG